MKFNLVSDIEQVFAQGGVSTSDDQNLLLRFDVLVQHAAKLSVLAVPVDIFRYLVTNYLETFLLLKYKFRRYGFVLIQKSSLHLKI